MGSCFPHRLQTGGGRRHRKSTGHQGHLSHCPSEQGDGGQGGVKAPDRQISGGPDLRGQRHGFPGVRAGDCGIA